MAITAEKLHHISNAVRREVEDEFPTLRLFFILYQSDNFREAVIKRTQRLVEITKNEALATKIESLTEKEAINKPFFGIQKEYKKFWPLPLSQEKHTAVFLLNRDLYNDETEARGHIYHLLYHALFLKKIHAKTQEKRIILHLKYNETPDLSEPTDQQKPQEMKSKGTPLPSQAYANMMADVFMVLMLKHSGQNNAIKHWARKRCELLFKATSHYEAELYPYPLAAESTQIVLDEFAHYKRDDLQPIRRHMDITEEVSFTFDEKTVSQWIDFAYAAQEMAWAGLDKNKILQTAIYTSEDPYVRSIAYLVAEYLNTDPAPLTDVRFYNPFTPDEANMRLHLRLCQVTFNKILERTQREEDNKELDAFIKREIKRQNIALVNGEFVGYCVPALLQAISIIQEISNDGQESEAASADKPSASLYDQLNLHFHEENQSHEKILQLFTVGRDIMSMRRNQEDLDIKELIRKIAA